jgi:L-gulonate 3-dehydrogenase
MAGSSVGSAAVVGAGLVGSAWAIVFARAGVNVRAFDASEDIRRTTAARIRASLEDMAKGRPRGRRRRYLLARDGR